MNGSRAFSPRVYRGLLRILVPSFDREMSDEAVATFVELARDARSRGVRSFVSFWVRESRSLFATAWGERRREKTRRGERKGANGSLHGKGYRGMRMDHLRQDLRYALRRLAGSPGFVLISVLSLSLAIAVSTVAFSVMNAAFFRPVPHVADQDRMVAVYTTSQRMTRGPHSFPDFQDYRETSETLSDLAAVGSREFAVGQVATGTRQVWGIVVSENYFQLMGIPMARGRGFLPEDVAAGGKVAVIGYNTWQRDFQGSPDVLGRTIHLNGQPHTIVGVGPHGMVQVADPMLLEVAVPLMDFRDVRGRLFLTVYGRLEEGVTVEQARAELGAMARNLVAAYPEDWDYTGEDPRGLTAVSLREARVPEGAPLAGILAGVGALVGLVMLIACSNVANLLLTRAFRRRAEIAVRSAIGAPARRVFAQLMVENLLLFGSAGALGLLLTHWIASLLASGWSVIPIPGLEFSVDLRVTAFAMVLALATGLLFGLIPAHHAVRVDLLPALKGTVPSMRFRFLGIRNLLVGAQVGGSLAMVLVTFLLVQSLSHVKERDLGFDPTGVATLTMDLAHRDYEVEEGRQFLDNLLARTAPIPGVEGVAYATRIPLAGGSTRYGGLEPEGYEPGPQEHVMAGTVVVSPGYLDVAGMRLLAGRDFNDQDREGSPQVLLVNQSFVDRYWPGEEGVGRRITFGSGTVREVVGVVADVAYWDLVSDVEPHLWLPLGQHYESKIILHARTSGDPQSLLPQMRRQIADLDGELPVIRADLMENISANATQPQRVASAALGATGFLTLCLAMLGIYGVVGYSVSQRTREMGLRIALGAEPRRVLRMVLQEGLALSLIGIVPGVLGALAAGQLLRSIFMGMNPLSPLAYGSGVGLLVGAVLAASLVPGLRAARGKPMESLRVE